MANLKAGSLVYWNKSGVRCYWNTDLNNPVDFLSEEFLEGEDAGHGYTEQFAFDVPHEGTSIPPSVVDTIAGTITGALVEKNGVNFYPIRMPFTFYNLDGQNRDDSTKSLKVFINTDDVSGDTSKVKKEKENKTIVDSVTGDTSDGLKKALTQTDKTDDAGKVSLGKKVVYGGLILLVLGGIYYLVTRNKNKQIVVTNQNIPFDNSQMRNVIPQPKFYTTQP